jgi:16S rRNA (uracil1498-N3)-methyltransferase
VSAPLFFVDDDRLVRVLTGVADDVVRLDGPEGRHAAKVRRLTPGERLDLSDGAGLMCRGTVAEVTGDGLLVRVLERHVIAPASPRIVVVQALAKGDRDELAVETMTEVGVDTIVPWAASRSIVRWDADRAAKGVTKWRSVAREASKQSRRPRLPVIAEPARTPAVADLIRAAVDAGGRGVVLHEAVDVPLAGLALDNLAVADAVQIVVVVGPEGGIADDELSSFEAAGATAYRLGPGVLRTSTAGAVAATVISVATGRWR